MKFESKLRSFGTYPASLSLALHSSGVFLDSPVPVICILTRF